MLYNFDKANPPSIAEPIEAHAEFLFRYVYSISYEQVLNNKNEGKSEIAVVPDISQEVLNCASSSSASSSQHYNVQLSNQENQILNPRDIHGAPHVARVAIYIGALVDHYAEMGDADAKKLAQDKQALKCVQIAGLLHDVSRENDGEDLWDPESSITCLRYLLKTGVEFNQARQFAEAIVNKDQRGKHYQQLTINDDGEIHLRAIEKEKTLYAQLVHDADCLDIMRCGYKYDGKRLDFYQRFVNHNKASHALDECVKIIQRAKILIIKNGDYPSLKSLTVTREQTLSISPAYYEKNLELFNSISMEAKGQQSKDHVESLYDEARLAARGIHHPSFRYVKNSHDDRRRSKVSHWKNKSNTAAEIIKLSRKEGELTHHGHKQSKWTGNPKRSVIPLSSKITSELFARSGLLFELTGEHFHRIDHWDSNSGYGNRKSRIHTKNKQNDLTTLDSCLLDRGLGTGAIEKSKHHDKHYYTGYPEAIMDLHPSNVVGIYYTNEPCFSDAARKRLTEENIFFHPAANRILAYYVLNEWQAIFCKQDVYSELFIYEISPSTCEIKKQVMTIETLLSDWKALCLHYIDTLLKHNQYDSVLNLSFEDIEKYACYINNVSPVDKMKDQLSVAEHYSKETKDRIVKLVDDIKKERIERENDNFINALLSGKELTSRMFGQAFTEGQRESILVFLNADIRRCLSINPILILDLVYQITLSPRALSRDNTQLLKGITETLSTRINQSYINYKREEELYKKEEQFSWFNRYDLIAEVIIVPLKLHHIINHFGYEEFNQKARDLIKHTFKLINTSDVFEILIKQHKALLTNSIDEFIEYFIERHTKNINNNSVINMLGYGLKYDLKKRIIVFINLLKDMINLSSNADVLENKIKKIVRNSLLHRLKGNLSLSNIAKYLRNIIDFLGESITAEDAVEILRHLNPFTEFTRDYGSVKINIYEHLAFYLELVRIDADNLLSDDRFLNLCHRQLDKLCPAKKIDYYFFHKNREHAIIELNKTCEIISGYGNEEKYFRILPESFQNYVVTYFLYEEASGVPYEENILARYFSFCRVNENYLSSVKNSLHYLLISEEDISSVENPSPISKDSLSGETAFELAVSLNNFQALMIFIKAIDTMAIYDRELISQYRYMLQRSLKLACKKESLAIAHAIVNLLVSKKQKLDVSNYHFIGCMDDMYLTNKDFFIERLFPLLDANMLLSMTWDSLYGSAYRHFERSNNFKFNILFFIVDKCNTKLADHLMNRTDINCRDLFKMVGYDEITKQSSTISKSSGFDDLAPYVNKMLLVYARNVIFMGDLKKIICQLLGMANDAANQSFERVDLAAYQNWQGKWNPVLFAIITNDWLLFYLCARHAKNLKNLISECNDQGLMLNAATNNLMNLETTKQFVNEQRQLYLQKNQEKTIEILQEASLPVLSETHHSLNSERQIAAASSSHSHVEHKSKVKPSEFIFLNEELLLKKQNLLQKIGKRIKHLKTPRCFFSSGADKAASLKILKNSIEAIEIDQNTSPRDFIEVIQTWENTQYDQSKTHHEVITTHRRFHMTFFSSENTGTAQVIKELINDIDPKGIDQQAPCLQSISNCIKRNI